MSATNSIWDRGRDFSSTSKPFSNVYFIGKDSNKLLHDDY